MECPVPVPFPDAAEASCPPREQPCPADGLRVRAGSGRLEIARVDGASAVVACRAASPLQLLTPSPRGRCAWVMPASHGGGLVAGDDVSLEVEVGAGATALLSTQAGTKIYRSGGALASQRLRARVGAGGLLAVLPHPVTCFAGARYRQDQRIALERGASLLWLDALTAGRVARGERWVLDSYASRLELSVGGALVLADALRLVPGEGPPVAERLEAIDLVATIVLAGPAVARQAQALLETLAAAPADGGAAVLAAASPLADGAIVRVASRPVEAGLAFLRETLAFVETVVGADPFARTP